MENDLISRSALLFVLSNDFFPAKGEFRRAMDIARFSIQDAPAVDAVEVVRCRECRHYDIYGYKICTLHSFLPSKYGRGANLYMDKDDFCSYGEKRSVDHD